MIFQEVTGKDQMALRGFNCTTPSNVITIPKEKDVIKFCACEFFCDYSEYAFADLSDDQNKYKNDYKSFLLSLKDDTSSYSFTLVTPTGEIPLIDETYGVLYDKGFNEAQPLQVGFMISWVKVLVEFGEGSYYVKIDQTDFDNTVSVETHKFKLKNWDEMRANYTTKIEFTQKGKILNGLDYSGIEWLDMVRVLGKFGQAEPQYEINSLEDSDYTDRNIQTKKFNTYQLETQLLPSSIGNIITDSIALTDEILISVYDVFSYEQYRQLKVSFEGTIDSGTDYSRNNMKRFVVTFKDKIAKLKRNFN